MCRQIFPGYNPTSIRRFQSSKPPRPQKPYPVSSEAQLQHPTSWHNRTDPYQIPTTGRLPASPPSQQHYPPKSSSRSSHTYQTDIRILDSTPRSPPAARSTCRSPAPTAPASSSPETAPQLPAARRQIPRRRLAARWRRTRCGWTERAPSPRAGTRAWSPRRLPGRRCMPCRPGRAARWA